MSNEMRERLLLLVRRASQLRGMLDGAWSAIFGIVPKARYVNDDMLRKMSVVDLVDEMIRQHEIETAREAAKDDACDCPICRAMEGADGPM